MLYSPTTGGFYSYEVHGPGIPADAIEITNELYEATKGRHVVPDADGLPRVFVQSPPDQAERVARLLAVVDDLLNSVAKAKGYDSIITASLRAGYPGPFHDEGVSFATWMDEVYAKCYQVLAQFEAGEIEEPDAEALLGILPARVLP